jgi:hypothetical protein
MSSLITRFYRRRKALLMALAALPLFQTTGTCDPSTLGTFIFQQTAQTAFGLFIGSIQQVALQNFPGSNVIQAFWQSDSFLRRSCGPSAVALTTL